MIEAISVNKKNKRKKVVGSLKTKIPTNTVPTAPIPVQTAYAVPIGSDCVALMSKPILTHKVIKKPTYHHAVSFPVDARAFPKQNANATSKSPAMVRIIQFILVPFLIDEDRSFTAIVSVIFS